MKTLLRLEFQSIRHNLFFWGILLLSIVFCLIRVGGHHSKSPEEFARTYEELRYEWPETPYQNHQNTANSGENALYDMARTGNFPLQHTLISVLLITVCYADRSFSRSVLAGHSKAAIFFSKILALFFMTAVIAVSYPLLGWLITDAKGYLSALGAIGLPTAATLLLLILLEALAFCSLFMLFAFAFTRLKTALIVTAAAELCWSVFINFVYVVSNIAVLQQALLLIAPGRMDRLYQGLASPSELQLSALVNLAMLFVNTLAAFFIFKKKELR